MVLAVSLDEKSLGIIIADALSKTFKVTVAPEAVLLWCDHNADVITAEISIRTDDAK